MNTNSISLKEEPLKEEDPLKRANVDDPRKGSHEVSLKRVKSNNTSDSPFIDMSVLGTRFTMLRSTVIETDWILSRAVDGDIPWGTYHEGRYYLDVDPVAFRSILHFIKNRTLPDGLAKIELSAIRALADYLAFSDLVNEIESLSDYEVNLEEENARLQQLLTDAEGILNAFN
jgi:hypothetical protein